MLSPQEYREQADQCIGWVRAAVSDSERKLYRQLAVFWLENALRLEPRAIGLPGADAVALPVISPTMRQPKRGWGPPNSPPGFTRSSEAGAGSASPGVAMMTAKEAAIRLRGCTLP